VELEVVELEQVLKVSKDLLVLEVVLKVSKVHKAGKASKDLRALAVQELESHKEVLHLQQPVPEQMLVLVVQQSQPLQECGLK
jgi:hypothetical protein